MSNSDANLALTKEIYDAYNKGDTTPLLNSLAEDFTMHEHSPDSIPWGGVWRGRDGMEHFIAAVTRNMTHEEYVCEDMIARDDIIVSWGHFKTRSKKSGQIIEGPWMHRILFCDGQIVEIHEFLDSLSVGEEFGLASLT